MSTFLFTTVTPTVSWIVYVNREKPETDISNVSILSSSKKGCMIRHNIVRATAATSLPLATLRCVEAIAATVEEVLGGEPIRLDKARYNLKSAIIVGPVLHRPILAIST